MRMWLLLSGVIGLGAGALAAQTPGFGAWSPRPPLGWNSYDAYGDSVTEKEVMANAKFMHDKLLPHGWNTVVVDFRWYDPAARSADLRAAVGARLTMDEYGRLQPAENRFPSAVGGKGFGPLAQSIHQLGLKFGIHVMRGIPRQAVAANRPIEGSSLTASAAADLESICSWNPDMYGVKGDTPAGQVWYDSIIRQYAAWGVDYLKVDDISHPYRAAEIHAIRAAIDHCGRPIILSLSPGETPVDDADDAETQANLWRISGDLWDSWKSVTHSFELLDAWKGHGGPGHWLDADMIPFGHLAIRNAPNGPDRRTRLTRDEQLAVLTLWSLASSPLMLGMNLPDNDEWAQSLLTNDEMLAVDQDPLGKPAQRLVHQNDKEVWMKELSGGDKAVGFFNLGDKPTTVVVFWPQAGLSGPCWVRDIWNKEDRAEADRGLEVPVEPHGAVLVRIHPITIVNRP